MKLQSGSVMHINLNMRIDYLAMRVHNDDVRLSDLILQCENIM